MRQPKAEPSFEVTTDERATIPAASAFEQFQRDRLGFLERCAAMADVVSCRLGRDDVLVLSRPDLVNDVLLTNRGDFSKAYLTDLMHPLLAGSLLLADSDSWLRERRLVLPAFHHERLAGYAEVMAEEATRIGDGWTQPQHRDLHADMMRMTLRVVTKTLFGIDFSKGVQVAERLVDTVMDEFNRRLAGRRSAIPLPSLRLLRLVRSLRALDRIAYGAIAERRRAPGSDLLSMLVAARDESGRPMTDREIRDACLAVFFAGHETTACLLSWTWFELARRPDVQERVLAEIEAAQEAPPATLPARTPYLQAVLNEVLRMYPPAYAFGRRAVRDTSVGGHAVPAGTTVLMSPWAMHRDPRYFDAPEEFQPERWLDGLASRLPRFAYFPFSSGPRRCVGSSFALMEATIAIAVILPRFAVSDAPARAEMAPSITLRPARGMRVRLTPR